MREIEFLQTGPMPDSGHLLYELWRIEQTDAGMSVEWIFWDFEDVEFVGTDVIPARPAWAWNNRGAWFCMFERNHPTSWGYVFKFTDGTRGICQVRHVNEALAELGCEINGRGDETD